jgi:galactokinase
MEIAAYFKATFVRAPAHTHFSPGRVNLIGEHTDYNGGAVLPTALPLGIEIALRPRADDRVRIASSGFDDVADRALGAAATGHWSDYACGAVATAHRLGWLDAGADIALSATLPMGSGLSSSAATIVGLLKACRALAGDAETEAGNVALAQSARAVETDFIGVPCGIMDQMAIALARPGQALFLDTRTLERGLIALPDDPVFVVLRSGVHRSLSDGRYKMRKEECDIAKHALGRDDLCRANASDLLTIQDETARRRARHCITEQARTLQAAKALEQKQMARFGALMVESHASMRDDFEVTTPAIDALVDTAVAHGALGARMTGGGFGGCIVALVPQSEMKAWKKAVLDLHPQARWVC